MNTESTHTVRHKSSRVKVLLYHRVLPSKKLCDEHPAMLIHVDEFRKQLWLLERWGFTAITFSDYWLSTQGELELPKRPVIITFDDGYEDTYEYAFPILQEFAMPSVVFVLGDRTIRTNSWDSGLNMPPGKLMNDQQIIELHEARHEIGAHSMTHADLCSLSKEAAWSEISRSRISLEILLNAPVKSFAYPYGRCDSEAKTMARDAGYKIGCAAYSGPPFFGRDTMEIRRMLVPGNLTALGFAARMLTPYEIYSWARWKAVRTVRPNRDGCRQGRNNAVQQLNLIEP
jgi:peptidoglycan/xylan/chitin deacetylase (PgdA/CDA1 family)